MPTSLARRAFLRGTGVCLALPLARRHAAGLCSGCESGDRPRRMVAIETNMGILPQFFFPEKAGRDYALDAVPGTARGASRAT